MAYQRPIVMVFQEYAKQSVSTPTATLNPCIVGPCFHLIDPIEDDLLAFAGDLTSAGVTDLMFPNNKPGAQIEESSVSVLLKDVQVALAATPFNSEGATENVLNFASGIEYPTNAKVGDYVDVVDGSDSSEVVAGARIIAVDAEAFSITLNKTLNTASISLEVSITRELDDTVLSYNSGELTIDAPSETLDIAPVTINVEGTDMTVSSASIYVGYKALRQDLSDVGTVYSLDEAKAALGKIDPDNPLGFAVSVTLANTTGAVKFVGVDSEDVAGFTAAKDLLETAEDIYAVVPLSQEAEIIGIFKGHAEQMSLPDVGKWRVCIGSTPLMTTSTLQEGTGTVDNDDGGSPIVIRDASAAFLSNGVDAGDTIALTADDETVAEYLVEEVIADDLLKVDNAAPIDAKYSVGNSYAYTIFKKLDKTQQAQAISDTSASFGSSRMVHVWPDVCVVDDQELPGYYLACTVAGMTGGLPSHQGFTRISVAGIGGVKHSNGYFNQDQLDKIADGGTFIFTQANPSAAPAVRHQLTTDMSTIEFREFSFVKNFDYVSIICKDVLDKFLGRYNITPSTLATLETAVRATLESLKLYNLPRIGSPVLGYDVVSVAQLDDIRDRVEMYVDVNFPYVLNTIGLHLVSQ